jgi:hypothetical protein
MSATVLSFQFLEGISGRDRIVIGPAPWFRLTASYIRKGPHGTIVGSFRGIIWEVEGRHYQSFECRSPVNIRFENASGKTTGNLGPFQYLRVVEGHITVESGLLARFNEEKRRWKDLATQGEWPDVLISPPDQ